MKYKNVESEGSSVIDNMTNDLILQIIKRAEANKQLSINKDTLYSTLLLYCNHYHMNKNNLEKLLEFSDADLVMDILPMVGSRFSQSYKSLNQRNYYIPKCMIVK